MRERVLVITGGLLVAAGLVAVILTWQGGLVTVGPGSSASTPPTSGALGPAPGSLGGPVAIYQVDDHDSSALVSLHLDGRSQAVVIADITRGDQDTAVRWDVEPRGRLALASVPGEDGLEISAFGMDGTPRPWSVTAPITMPDSVGTWSRDGRWWATIGVRFEDRLLDARELRAIALDTATGRRLTVDVEGFPWLQGVTDDGRLILLDRQVDDNGSVVAWRFTDLDPVSGRLAPVTIGPGLGVGPRSDAGNDVSPAVGLAVTRAIIETDADDRIEQVVIVDLGSGERIPIGIPWADVNVQAFAPDGRSVLLLQQRPWVDGAPAPEWVLSAFTADGAARELWHGPADHAAEAVLSADGDYIGWTSPDLDTFESVIQIVELASGRDVTLPVWPAATAALRAIIGGRPMPVIAVAPTPAPPTPAPVDPAAVAIDGAPLLVRSSIELDDDDATRTIRVELLAPAVDGGVARVALMPPILLPPMPDRAPGDSIGSVDVAVRPDGGLVAVTLADDVGGNGWWWTPGEGRTPIDLPDGLTGHLHAPTWRPDGRAVAFVGESRDGDGGVRSRIVILGPDDAAVVHEPPALFGELSGWTTDGRALVLQHGVCTEGCDFDHPWSWTMDPASGAVEPVKARDTTVGFAGLLLWHQVGNEFTLLTSEPIDPRSIRLAVPSELGLIDSDAIEVLVPAGTNDLVVALTRPGGTTIHRWSAPLSTVVDGRVTATPTVAGTLPTDLRLRSVSPDGAWALGTKSDRSVWLVDLATGSTTLVEGPDAAAGWLDWAGPG